MQRDNGARGRAWETRRQRYGNRGHAGSYARSPADREDGLVARAERRLARLVAATILTGALSEGQVCAICDIGRIDVRHLRDDGRDSIEADPIPGAWGANATKEITS